MILFFPAFLLFGALWSLLYQLSLAARALASGGLCFEGFPLACRHTLTVGEAANNSDDLFFLFVAVPGVYLLSVVFAVAKPLVPASSWSSPGWWSLAGGAANNSDDSILSGFLSFGDLSSSL